MKGVEREQKGEQMLIKIYTDGACSGNPGKGGYGTILIAKDDNGKIHRKELTEGFKVTTNNRMELLAAIIGLEALKKPCDVELTSDSKYLVDAFNQNWIKKKKKQEWLETTQPWRHKRIKVPVK